jgi:hypothetical protein
MAAQRGCDVVMGTGRWPSTMGGLSNAYAMIPIAKMTGMTTGGTRYFMDFHAKQKGIAAALPPTNQNILDSTAIPKARQASRIIA